MGMVTTQSSHAQCGVPNFPIVRERPLLLILGLKLPGNVAHGDHTQHVHSARPHTMASLPAHPGPAETPSSTLLIAKIGKTCHVSVQRSVQHDLKHCVLSAFRLSQD